MFKDRSVVMMWRSFFVGHRSIKVHFVYFLHSIDFMYFMQ